MSNNDLARNLVAQDPGRGKRHALAAGTPIVSYGLGQGQKRGTAYKVAPDAGDSFTISRPLKNPALDAGRRK